MIDAIIIKFVICIFMKRKKNRERQRAYSTYTLKVCNKSIVNIKNKFINQKQFSKRVRL